MVSLLTAVCAALCPSVLRNQVLLLLAPCPAAVRRHEHCWGLATLHTRNCPGSGCPMQLKPFFSHLDSLSIKTCLSKETEETVAQFLAPTNLCKARGCSGGGCERWCGNTGATGKHQASASETAWKTAAAGASQSLQRDSPRPGRTQKLLEFLRF